MISQNMHLEVGKTYIDKEPRSFKKWPWQKQGISVVTIESIGSTNSDGGLDVQYRYITSSGIRGTGAMTREHAQTLIPV